MCFDIEVCMSECLKVKNLLKNTKGVSISYSDFIIRACAKTLREFPIANSYLKDDRILIYDNVNIGFAVNSPKGLIVPVIFKADQRNYHK